MRVGNGVRGGRPRHAKRARTHETEADGTRDREKVGDGMKAEACGEQREVVQERGHSEEGRDCLTDDDPKWDTRTERRKAVEHHALATTSGNANTNAFTDKIA